MKILVTKIFLLIATIFIFGAFQYGGINTPPPFANTWQSFWSIINVGIASLILLEHIIRAIRLSIRIKATNF